MEKIDLRGLPDAVLNERRRRAMKLREAGVSVRQVARQCELSTHTVVARSTVTSPSRWQLMQIESRNAGWSRTGLTTAAFPLDCTCSAVSP